MEVKGQEGTSRFAMQGEGLANLDDLRLTQAWRASLATYQACDKLATYLMWIKLVV